MGREQDGQVTVVLSEQDRRFAYDKKRKIEGILRIEHGRKQAVINVKVNTLDGSRGVYKLFLIGRKSGSSVYKTAGEIYPDRRGSASFEIAVDPEDADGEGTELSCFYIFMIAAAGTPLRPVLKGDMEPSGRQQKKESAPPKQFNDYYKEYIRLKTAELLDTAADFMEILPFDDVWLADRWLRVTDAGKLPVASAGAEEQLRRYGHFIFAHRDNLFLLAVPGKHTEEEWPDRGASGFCMWQPIRKSREYGYWCMVIDRKSGIITEIS